MLEAMISVAQEAAVAAPVGGVSPLAWVIIVALAVVIMGAVPTLWYRGNKIQDQMYEDLKACNEKRLQSEEDQLGLLKVLRVQMEHSKGGKKK